MKKVLKLTDRQVISAARQLADFAADSGLSGAALEPRKVCDHLGAALADSILQAGLNYKNVVLPRIGRIIKSYPEAASLPGLVDTLERQGTCNFLCWHHQTKLRRFELLVDFLRREGINDTRQLRRKLTAEKYQIALLEIDGIGPKTVDYLGCLLGLDVVAIDRHVINFSVAAGLPKLDYFGLQKVASFAADLLGVPRRDFDSQIWRHMTGHKSAQYEMPLD